MALRTHHQFGRTRVALATAIALLSQPLTPVMGQTAAVSSHRTEARGGDRGTDGCPDRVCAARLGWWRR